MAAFTVDRFMAATLPEIDVYGLLAASMPYREREDIEASGWAGSVRARGRKYQWVSPWAKSIGDPFPTVWEGGCCRGRTWPRSRNSHQHPIWRGQCRPVLDVTPPSQVITLVRPMSSHVAHGNASMNAPIGGTTLNAPVTRVICGMSRIQVVPYNMDSKSSAHPVTTSREDRAMPCRQTDADGAG